MPIQQAGDYIALKEGLLKRFQLTEEGFRNKFHDCKAEVGEAPNQFLARLENYFTRWIELADTEKTYEGIRDLLIREQYLQTSSRDLVLFIRERKPRTNAELSTLAERYLDAHAGKTKMAEQRRFDSENNSMPETDNKQSQDASALPATGKEFKKEEKKCFICFKTGYIAKDCYAKGNVKQKVGAVVNEEDVCTDHLDHQCGRSMQLLNACELTTSMKNTSVVTGHIAGKSVKVLRDTGSSTVVVRRSLVHDKQMTGTFQLCKLIDGTVRRVPCAVIYIDTPFFTGRVNVVCMMAPLYDVIIGNISGATEQVRMSTAAGQTRAQKFHGKGDKPRSFKCRVWSRSLSEKKNE